MPESEPRSVCALVIRMGTADAENPEPALIVRFSLEVTHTLRDGVIIIVVINNACFASASARKSCLSFVSFAGVCVCVCVCM